MWLHPAWQPNDPVPRNPRKYIVRRSFSKFSAVLALAVVIVSVLVGCGRTSATVAGSSSIPLPVQVKFTAETTYGQAVRSVTDLGLRTTLPCQASRVQSESSQRWFQWGSFGEEDDYNRGWRMLWVAPTLLAPKDWQERLSTLPIVQTLLPTGNVACPAGIYDAQPTPGTSYFVLPSGVDVYAQITLRPSAAYSDVVANMSDLGIRLADPCYEKRVADGASPTWHAMGQEQQYAASHTLIIATTTDSSDTWSDQLRSLTTVKTLQTPYAASC